MLGRSARPPNFASALLLLACGCQRALLIQSLQKHASLLAGAPAQVYPAGLRGHRYLR